MRFTAVGEGAVGGGGVNVAGDKLVDSNTVGDAVAGAMDNVLVETGALVSTGLVDGVDEEAQLAVRRPSINAAANDRKVTDLFTRTSQVRATHLRAGGRTPNAGPGASPYRHANASPLQTHPADCPANYTTNGGLVVTDEQTFVLTSMLQVLESYRPHKNAACYNR